MLVEVNGMSFHLRVSKEGMRAKSASIVDEAFLLEPVHVAVSGPGCVIALIENYSGMRVDQEVRDQVMRQMGSQSLAA